MSGVYITGMEMPKDDEILYLRITPSGKVSIAMDLKCREIARALPVPDHGRLIDADASEKAVCNACDGACDFVECDCIHCEKDCRCDVMRTLHESPTIIPGEEGRAEHD